MIYDYKKLGKEITDLDRTAHHHSIVAIRDSFEKYPNRFLVYQDEAWHCRLFLNYPTQSDKEKNVAFIKEKISTALKIPVEDISLLEVTQALQQRYSEKHHEMRVYDHVFYEAHLSSFSDTLQQTSFSIDGVMYYWMTLVEMERDADIKKKNLDVVQEIEKHV